MVTRILLFGIIATVAVTARAAPPREPDVPPLAWLAIVNAVRTDVPEVHKRALAEYEALTPAGKRAAALGMAVLYTKLARFAEADKLVRALPAATREQLQVQRLRLFLACELCDPAEAKELYRKLPTVTPTTGEGLTTAWLMGALIAVLERDETGKVLAKADRERIRDKLSGSPAWRPTKSFDAGYAAAQKRAVWLETFLEEWKNDTREQLLMRCEKFEAELVEARIAIDSLPQRLAGAKLEEKACSQQISDFEAKVLAATPGMPISPPRIYVPEDPDIKRGPKSKDRVLTPASRRAVEAYEVAYRRWRQEALGKAEVPPEIVEAKRMLGVKERVIGELNAEGMRSGPHYQELQLQFYTATILAASERKETPDAVLARPAVYQLLDFRAEAELLQQRGPK